MAGPQASNSATREVLNTGPRHAQGGGCLRGKPTFVVHHIPWRGFKPPPRTHGPPRSAGPASVPGSPRNPGQRSHERPPARGFPGGGRPRLPGDPSKPGWRVQEKASELRFVMRKPAPPALGERSIAALPIDGKGDAPPVPVAQCLKTTCARGRDTGEPTPRPKMPHPRRRASLRRTTLSLQRQLPVPKVRRPPEAA